MKQSTLDCMNEMVDWVNEDPKNVVIPMFFQSHGRATVSAAVRVAKKRSLLVQDGVDGVGNPKYAAAPIKETHTVSNTVN